MTLGNFVSITMTATHTSSAQTTSVQSLPYLTAVSAPLRLFVKTVSNVETIFAAEFQVKKVNSALTMAVSYTHLPSPRDRQKSRMPSSA